MWWKLHHNRLFAPAEDGLRWEATVITPVTGSLKRSNKFKLSKQ